MTPRFIGEKISVEVTGTIKQPIRLTWRDINYEIAEILQNWVDWGFGGGTAQRSWQSRRHRNYYRIRTNSDEIFEIYLDRSRTIQGEWYLYQQIDAEASDS